MLGSAVPGCPERWTRDAAGSAQMTTDKETAGHLVTGVPQPSGMAARAVTTGDGTRS